jgi:HD domain
MTGIQERDVQRWRERRALARLLRTLIFTVPLAASIAGGILVSRLVHPASGFFAALVRFLAIAGTSTLILVCVDRTARRFLPLAALLRLTLAFPDRAPSRFSLALRAGTTKSLEKHASRARALGAGDVAQAAEAILTLAAALNVHDRATRGHCERVRAFIDLLADEMKLATDDRDRLRWAGLLHDVGKLKVAPAILNKPSEPDESEWEILRRHPDEGARLMSPLAAWLGPWAASVEQHHERWDGTGYPRGLAGEQICLGGRMVAVADAFEVMTSTRPYQRPVSADAARKELARCAGSHFDPVTVRAFLNISVGRLRATMGPLSWLAQLPFVGGLPQWEGTAAAMSRQAAVALGTTGAASALVINTMVNPAYAMTARPTARVVPVEASLKITTAVPPTGPPVATSPPPSTSPPVATSLPPATSPPHSASPPPSTTLPPPSAKLTPAAKLTPSAKLSPPAPPLPSANSAPPAQSTPTSLLSPPPTTAPPATLPPPVAPPPTVAHHEHGDGGSGHSGHGGK